ncbi:hypothetical protein QQF73_16120 [Marinobacter sp. M216]|uniref:Uncharacterized protein n=1 Tax=Marinobacter albus TaxID=3030833 RepID=A0ABT7HHX2_9GAMM|nr:MULTISPECIES: hypothetical protein [unclassified Marinobacter]MDK9559161.1 hypothetical protein [Marinobacter sp. M216]
MECVPGNEYQIARAYSLCFVTHFEVDVAFNDYEYLLVVGLRVEGISTVTNNSDIRSQMLTIENKYAFDRVVFG